MTSTTSDNYAQWLQKKMTDADLSQRQLGARLTPNDPEIGRRSVRRYLKGMVPTERSRTRIAEALGSGDDIGPDGSDSEDD